MDLLNKFENFILDVKGVTDSDYKEITDFYNVRFDNKENAELEADLDYSSLKRERDLFVHTLKKDKNLKKICVTTKSKEKKKSANAKQSANKKFLVKENDNDESSNMLQLKDVVFYLKDRPNERSIFPQITKLVKLLMTIPASSCTNERSFFQAPAFKKLFTVNDASRSFKRYQHLEYLFGYSQPDRCKTYNEYLYSKA